MTCPACGHRAHEVDICRHLVRSISPNNLCGCNPRTAIKGIRSAMERAVERYGAAGSSQEGVFNLAGLSNALKEMSGEFIGGSLGRVILADRDDVEQFGPSDCYRRIKPPSRSNAARILGAASASKAGRASAAALTKAQRQERARAAAGARWAKARKAKP